LKIARAAATTAPAGKRRQVPSLRYSDPRATPEYITKEKARKRLANRREWVTKWWPRIAAEVKEEKTSDQT
jgi:hypothetical protein